MNRTLAQPLAAWKNRSRHLRYLRHLNTTQYDAPENIQQRQLKALQKIVHHAATTVPWYQAAWARLDTQIRSLADLQSLPILEKSHLRGHEDEFLSRDYRKADLLVKRTSGSTGVPLTIYLDKAGKEFKYACTLRGDEWSGWRRGQRVAKVWGNPEYQQFGWRGRLRNTLLERAVYLDTLNMDGDSIRAFITHLRRKPPGLIFGHAHSLYLLAQLVEPGTITPQGIISTAMPLHAWQRTVIEAAFGTKVTDRYGCEEVSLIASECECHQGMHINADSVYCETDGDGKLIITDLTNKAMPLIRYRNGDVATLSDRRCPCGRGLPMLERVMGRDADYVTTAAGRLISGISLTENFALKVQGTAQMQIVQETVHHLRIRIVPAPEFNDASRRQIADLVTETFGTGVRHDVELLDCIPQEASGKYRFCISKVSR